MKTISISIAVALLSGLMLAGAHGRVPEQNPTPATVAGHVVDKASGKPIGQATVTLRRVMDSESFRATVVADGGPAVTTLPRPQGEMNIAATTAQSAADGGFTFPNLPAGDYRLTVSIEHYITYEYGQRTVRGKGTAMTIRAGERMEALSLLLTRKGAITGTIVDPTGALLSNVEIRVYSQFEPFDRTGPLLREVGTSKMRGDVGTTEPFSIMTDNQGRYRMSDLEPGEYYVAARVKQNLPSNSMLGESVSRLLGNGGPGPLGFLPIPTDVPVPLFYPNGVDAPSARPVYVPPAGEISGIDMTLRPIESVVVSGSVVTTGDVANGTAGIRVKLFPVGPSSALRSGLTAIATADGATGSFQFSGVVPGAYKVFAVSGQGDRLAAAIQEIDIQSGRQHILRLRLQKVFDITGQAILEAPVPPDLRIVMSLNEDYDGLNAVQRDLLTLVNPDGSFVIRNVIPGARYRVSHTVLKNPRGFFTGARYGDNDIDTMFVTRADATTLQLRFQTAEYGRVDAVARDGEKPVGGSFILLVPTDLTRKGLYRSLESDGAGAATLYSVFPGDYKLFAFEGVKDGAWFDPRFLGKYGGLGRPVHMDVGATIKETIQVINGEGGLN